MIFASHPKFEWLALLQSLTSITSLYIPRRQKFQKFWWLPYAKKSSEHMILCRLGSKKRVYSSYFTPTRRLLTSVEKHVSDNTRFFVDFEGMTTENNLLHYNTIGIWSCDCSCCKKLAILRKYLYWSGRKKYRRIYCCHGNWIMW